MSLPPQSKQRRGHDAWTDGSQRLKETMPAPGSFASRGVGEVGRRGSFSLLLASPSCVGFAFVLHDAGGIRNRLSSGAPALQIALLPPGRPPPQRPWGLNYDHGRRRFYDDDCCRAASYDDDNCCRWLHHDHCSRRNVDVDVVDGCGRTSPGVLLGPDSDAGQLDEPGIHHDCRRLDTFVLLLVARQLRSRDRPSRCP